MSTIDTSTWNPDADLNTEIGGIPLNADASIQQTWQAIQMLMAALKGDTAAIELTINQPDGTTIVATNQTLTVVDNSHAHTIANVTGLQTALDGKAADSGTVHTTGTETVNGSKTFGSSIKINNSASDRNISGMANGSNEAPTFLRVMASSSVSYGAHLQLNGKDYSGAGGDFNLVASVGASSYRKTLLGTASGTLSWDGDAIQTASDERLKTPLSTVPDKVLDAWSDVQWGQFQFLEAIQEKGESARIHLGLVAQRVKAAFEARGLDACTFGILCHEERPAADEEGADTDLWMVRYTEALAMEAAFQRRRADRLEARIKALEEDVKNAC